MEPEGSLSNSQEPTNCPHNETDQSSPSAYSILFMIHFNIIYVWVHLVALTD
jgi:hypothetical protein